MKLYTILPCYNEEETLKISPIKVLEEYDRLKESGRIDEDSRILFVDDGSKDSTWDIIRRLHDENPVYEGIRLSGNRGHQTALYAGMKYALDKGADCMVTIDADLQQDIGALPLFIDSFKDGNDIVYGVRKSRKTDGWFKRMSATMYYGLMKLMGCNTIKNSADYRLMSAKAVASLCEYKESNLFIRGLVPEVGYKSDTVYFDVKERQEGRSKYSVNKMLLLAFDGITSLTIRPIRLITFCGFITFIVSVVMMIITLSDHLRGVTVPGWTTLTISIWLLGGIQLLSLGILGEYIGRTYMETKNRPRYFISETTDEVSS